MRVEVWSDIICPWCYLGNVRLKRAIARLDDPSSVDLRTRSFELDPYAPREPAPNLERLAAKYGVDLDGAMQMEQRIVALAEAEEIPFVVERPSANSLNVHRAVWLAREFDCGEELFDRLQFAFFGEGADVFDGERIVSEAAALGVPEARVREMLSGDEFTEQVRADEMAAEAIGVRGVPFAVIDERYAVPGAVSSDQYFKILTDSAEL